MSGDTDQQRRAGGKFIVRVLVPQSVITELPAVIALQHDGRVVAQAFLFERIEQATDLRDGVADLGVVAVTRRLRELGGKRIALRHTRVVVQFAVGVTGELGHAGREMVDGGNGDWVGIIKIPVLFLARRRAGAASKKRRRARMASGLAPPQSRSPERGSTGIAHSPVVRQF